jgi:hypothetical protein
MIPGERSTAGGLLFATQAMLDSWADQGRIELSGDVMTVPIVSRKLSTCWTPVGSTNGMDLKFDLACFHGSLLMKLQ